MHALYQTYFAEFYPNSGPVPDYSVSIQECLPKFTLIGTLDGVEALHLARGRSVLDSLR
jgi:hypothetical protein